MSRAALSPALASLRRFAAASAPARCELCSTPMGEHHDHLLSADGELSCACPACAQVFDDPAAHKIRVRPRVSVVDADPVRAAWDTPIRLGWVVGGAHPRLCYPGPAGVLQDALSPAAWQRLADAVPELATLDPTAALLVDLRKTPRAFVVSIDHCYAVVGLVRRHWHGMSGGPAVTRELDTFFARLAGEAPR